MHIRNLDQVEFKPVQDEQECNIKFGSWTTDGSVLNLTKFKNQVNKIQDQVDLTNFANSSSAYIVTRHIEGARNVKKFPCCPDEPYIDLDFK